MRLFHCVIHSSVLGLCMMILSGCCKKSDDIAVYRVEKPEPQAAASASPSAPSSMPMSSDMAGQAAPAQAVAYAWDVPTEWKPLPATGMRLASFTFEASDKTIADISVIVLTGDAGGLTANINRWRGQIGLDALSDADVTASIQSMSTAAGEVQTCVYTNPATKQGVTAGILVDAQETWFFKVSGPALAVTESQPSFNRFLESLRKNP